MADYDYGFHHRIDGFCLVWHIHAVLFCHPDIALFGVCHFGNNYDTESESSPESLSELGVNHR